MEFLVINQMIVSLEWIGARMDCMSPAAKEIQEIVTLLKKLKRFF